MSKRMTDANASLEVGLLSISKLANKLNDRVPQLTISTAQIYFMTFYSKENNKSYLSRFMIPTCLFLACKTQESSRKLRDICHSTIREVYMEEANEENMDSLRRTILFYEDVLLRVLGFDLHPVLPYVSLQRAIHEISPYNHSTIQLRVSAFGFLNDSFTTVIHLFFDIEIIVAAILYLACFFTNTNLPSDWKRICEVDMAEEDDVDQAIDMLLDMYSSLDDPVFLEFANSVPTPWQNNSLAFPSSQVSALTPLSLGHKTPLSTKEETVLDREPKRDVGGAM